MPKPLPPNISKSKANLVECFKRHLLSKQSGFSLDSCVFKELIVEIIKHKSFVQAFTYEIQYRKTIRVCDCKEAINHLADSIDAYLRGRPFVSQGSYDKWHKKVGQQFLADINPFGSFGFGKAQKVINLTMKHLFCYEISPDYFSFCHVTLDSIIYTGRKQNALDNGFYRNEVNPNASVKAWSNLTYKEYLAVQKDMRVFLRGDNHPYKDSNTGLPLSGFEAEFYIWPIYRVRG